MNCVALYRYEYVSNIWHGFNTSAPCIIFDLKFELVPAMNGGIIDPLVYGFASTIQTKGGHLSSI
jgi:hypothetical protein